jgi:hypothetical protein
MLGCSMLVVYAACAWCLWYVALSICLSASKDLVDANLEMRADALRFSLAGSCPLLLRLPLPSLSHVCVCVCARARARAAVSPLPLLQALINDLQDKRKGLGELCDDPLEAARVHARGAKGMGAGKVRIIDDNSKGRQMDFRQTYII